MVQLNGRVRCDPETPVDLARDKVSISDRPITAREYLYLALNKPRGVVTTAADEKGRTTVYDYLDPNLPWVAPVGRLDKASEGLLLLTNDGEWAAAILAPESRVQKIYHAQIRSTDPDAIATALRAGVVSQGERLRVTTVSVLRHGRSNAWLEITLHEGKNRHIRRMMDDCGAEVLRLLRVSIGPLPLGDLAKGCVRTLSPAEKAALDADVASPLG